MRPHRIAKTTDVFAWAARRIRQDRLLYRVPGSERGSVALGVAIVALTTRTHPHVSYGTSHGTTGTAGLIIAAVVVIFFIVRWFMLRNRRS